MSGKYTIELSGSRPQITLDGKELSAKEVYLAQRENEFPMLTVVLDPSSIRANGEGNYELQAPQANIADFIKKIDIQKLEEAVMARTPFSDNVFQNVKEVLSEWANA